MFNGSRITKYPDDKHQSSQHSPSMAPRHRDIPFEPSPAAPFLGNPNTRALQTTTATIKMTSPPATINSAASVRARCNLIGKMINDVSKTMRTATDTAVSALPAALSDVVVDFPANTSTTDASSMINIKFPTPLIMKRATQERESKLTTTVNSPMPTTQAGITPKYCYGGAIIKQQQPSKSQKSASSAKSKSTENKCPAKELTAVSYQREVVPNRTFNRLQLETENNWIQPESISSNRKHKLNVEVIKVAHKQQLRLAERNKKLKSEFLSNIFPDIANSSSGDRIQKTAAPNVQLQSRSLKSSSTNYSKLRISAAQTKSPLAEQQTLTAAVLETSKLTLVAQRKLELKCKFEQQKHSNIATPTTKDCQTRNVPHQQYFPSVQQLRQRFDSKMIVNPNKLSDTASPEPKISNLLALKRNALEQRHSPLSDEGCNLGQSPYSSDDDNDNVSIRTASTTVERKRKDKVARSASSDSALGLEVDADDAMDAVAEAPIAQQQQQQQQQRRMTLTVTDLPLRPALLPLAEPTALPDSPTHELQSNVLTQTTVPSKVLLEERVVEIPEDPRGACSLSSSRRESAQSCLSDYPISECGGVRFVRTPSVVVSDYSDDVMCGITLEEIEYFRAQRMRRRRSSLDTTSGTEKDVADGGTHSDVSASSSCSNLYYCGSTISALDGAECYVNGMRMPLATERKASACSTCSASGGEDDDAVFSIPEQPEEPGQLGKDLADLLAGQHLNTKRPKKVGVCEQCMGIGVGGV